MSTHSSTWTEFPDGGHDWFAPASGPRVVVRFPDGGQVSFRTDGEWPRHARVQYRGRELAGLVLDVDATVDPDGKISAAGVTKMTRATRCGETR
jgi:hypothetical protein